MHTINMREAKTHLSRLVNEVMAGGEVVIARSGKPIVKLVPLIQDVKARKLGILSGRLSVPADFDAPLPDEVLSSFEGR